jgi:hypothetical protein
MANLLVLAGTQHDVSTPGARQEQPQQPQQQGQHRAAGRGSAASARPASAAAAGASEVSVLLDGQSVTVSWVLALLVCGISIHSLHVGVLTTQVQHAAKRRKTVTPTSEEYVARTVNVQQVAGETTRHVLAWPQSLTLGGCLFACSSMESKQTHAPICKVSACCSHVT